MDKDHFLARLKLGFRVIGIGELALGTEENAADVNRIEHLANASDKLAFTATPREKLGLADRKQGQKIEYRGRGEDLVKPRGESPALYFVVMKRVAGLCAHLRSFWNV